MVYTLSAEFPQSNSPFLKRKSIYVNMFSLIWCYGLISFVLPAHSNNDTLHGGYKLNIRTTISTLPSTTIPASKDYGLETKKVKSRRSLNFLTVIA